MTAHVIDGRGFAFRLRKRVLKQVTDLKNNFGKVPCLATILVGENPASIIYIRNKEKQAVESGIKPIGQKLPSDISEKSLISLIEKLNADSSISGILVQLPLPAHINPLNIIDKVRPEKDVDGFHPVNVGALVNGNPKLIPCTPMGCHMLIKDQIGDISGANAVIAGRSNIVGKPMASLLLNENCTTTIAHSQTSNIENVCRGADILVTAIGKPNFIKASWIKPGSVIIDVGINRSPRRDRLGRHHIVGDVDFKEACNIAGAITPVPGGVGPMTVACLLQNTLTAFMFQNENDWLDNTPFQW